MVTIVCSPAESQFGEIARADDESIVLIGKIHENLRALTCLAVFVGDIMNADVVANVLEMLYAGIANAYFELCDAQFCHQADGIRVSSVGSAEARHGDADDALTVVAQLVVGPYAHEQGKGRIETSADADNDILAPRMDETLGETCHLDAEYLFARCRHIVLLRNERRRIDIADEFEVLDGNAVTLLMQGLTSYPLGIDEGSIVTALATHAFVVNLRHNHLRLKREALAVLQAQTILVYHGIAAIDDILSALTKTTPCIDISAHGACTLLGEEILEIDMLADEFVGGAEIENDVGASERELR